MEVLKMETFDILENVELMASGYEWTCPYCPYVVNKENEITETVTCRKCKRIFNVSEYEHALA